MKGRLLLGCLCLASVGVAADGPQCARIANMSPAGVSPTNQFRIFKNQWIVNEIGTVFASSDQGATWQSILPKPPNVTVHTTLIEVFDGALFAVPQTGNFIMTTRDGVNWTTVATPVQPIFFAAVGDLWAILTHRPGDFSVIDVRLSRDAGHTWTRSPNLEPVVPPQFEHGGLLVRSKSRILLTDNVDIAIRGHIPAGRGSLTRVHRLSPNADRWEDVTPCACNISIQVLNDNESVLFGELESETGGGPGQLLVTNDAGTTWSYRSMPTGSGGIGSVSADGGVAMSFGPQDTLFTVRYAFSADGGSSWQSVGDGLPTFPPGNTSDVPELFGIAANSLLFQNLEALYSCKLSGK